MATPDSSGVQRRRVRLDGNRPRTHPSARSRRKPPRKPLKAKAGPRDRSLQDSLTDIAQRLEVIGAVAAAFSPNRNYRTRTRTGTAGTVQIGRRLPKSPEEH
jgi:hypothetical protein